MGIEGNDKKEVPRHPSIISRLDIDVTSSPWSFTVIVLIVLAMVFAGVFGSVLFWPALAALYVFVLLFAFSVSESKAMTVVGMSVFTAFLVMAVLAHFLVPGFYVALFSFFSFLAYAGFLIATALRQWEPSTNYERDWMTPSNDSGRNNMPPVASSSRFANDDDLSRYVQSQIDYNIQSHQNNGYNERKQDE